MDYIRFAISNPVKVSVGVLLVLLFGFLSLFAIPVQLTPNVDQPVITVTTNWTGHSPEEIERDVIEPQEDKLKGISGLRKMEATAQTGMAQITLEFFIGTNLSRALQEVSDSLREVPDYPDNVDQPVVASADVSAETPIAWMVLTADDPAFNVEQLQDLAEERIKPFLERVPGLAEVRVYGGRQREVHIQIDPARLAERGITFNQLRQALQLANVDMSAGDLADGIRETRIRTVGRFEDPREVEETIVAYGAGGPVRVRDLGTVEVTLERRRSFVRARGTSALALPAYRETGSNVVSVMEGLSERLQEVNDELLPAVSPPGVQLRLEKVYDETVYIYDAIDLVQSNLWLGGTLAVIVLLLFLAGSRAPLLVTLCIAVMVASVIVLMTVHVPVVWWTAMGVLAICLLIALLISRPVAIIGLAIPISVVGTFVAMTAAGRNLNVISLAGLAFAVGMVVDSAIVVLENIDRHRDMGKRPMQAAYDGAKEVWGAVLASTLTTVAVFVPVLFIQEEAGQLFRDIALAICAAVLLSLLVSVTVIPTAAGHWLRPRPRTTGPQTVPAGVFGFNRAIHEVARAWAGVIHFLTRPGLVGAGLRIVIVLLVTVGAVGASFLLMPPTSYLPTGNRNLVFGMIFTPPAYTINHNETIARRVESHLAPYWEADSYADTAQLPPLVDFMTGQTIERVAPIDNFFFVSFGPMLFMGGASVDKENVAPLSTLLTTAINTIPDAFGGAEQISIFGPAAANSVQVDLKGPDLGPVLQAAGAMFQRVATDPNYGYQRVRPDPGNFNLPSPELQVKIDRVRAADLGIDVTALGLATQALVDGAIVGDYRLGGESVDLLLVRDPNYPLTPDTIPQVPLAYRTGDGQMGTVPLGAVVDLRPTDAPQVIKRIEELRAVSLTVSSPPGEALETTMQRLEAMAQELRQQGQIPLGVEVDLAGTASKLTEVRSAMLGRWSDSLLETAKNVLLSRAFIALLITYLLMAALFESFLYPFVIMFSVPLAAVGGFLGLRLMHEAVPDQQLDVLTMLGFIILIGIVVNNAILIVHQSLNYMRGESDVEGREAGTVLSPRDAIRESVRTRIRPVTMTTATSVFGMLPLVLMPGAGSELYKGLGSVVVGGLTMATIFTLLVVPLVFSLVLDGKAWLYRRLGWELPELAPSQPTQTPPAPRRAPEPEPAAT